MPARRYNVPSGRVRRRFIHALATETKGFQKCRWNTERFIVFQMVILQRAWHMTKSYDIRRQINQRLDAWEAGDHEMLAEDTACTSAHYLSTSMGEDSPENWENIYHSLVIHGKLCLSVRCITDKEKSRVFHPEEICPKTGQPVLEVLRSKHTKALPPMASVLEA